MKFSSLDPLIEDGMAPYFTEGDGLPGSPGFSASVGVNHGWQLSSNLFGDLVVHEPQVGSCGERRCHRRR